MIHSPLTLAMDLTKAGAHCGMLAGLEAKA